MKKIAYNAIVSFMILLTGMVSCEKGKTNTNPVEKVKKILEFEARMNAFNSGTGKMTSFMSVIGYSQLKEGQLDMNGSGTEPGYPDSVYIDTANYWEPITCAIVTEIDNEDGTHTTIYDYGDGCEEYGSLCKGKITYIWKNDNNSYYSEVIYDHYYSYGVEMNGNSRYTFTSDGNSYYSIAGKEDPTNDSTVTIMPVEFNWSGTSTGHDDISMVFDDGNSTYYKSDFLNMWDSISYKVLQGDSYYSSTSDGYEYHYLVTEPLITDYRCTNSWVPVSGVETITSTENGETSVIDFGDLYKIFDGGDGTVVPSNGRKGLK